jgi:hypothetical protein
MLVLTSDVLLNRIWDIIFQPRMLVLTVGSDVSLNRIWDIIFQPRRLVLTPYQ